MNNTKSQTTSTAYQNLFVESRPELNPSLSHIEELKGMDSHQLGWWGVGWWQGEAVKQAIRAECRQIAIDQMQATIDELRAKLRETGG